MEKFSAPYNFVPLNKHVYVPSWYNKVSQDIPFEDGEDGYIEVTWKNISPLFIRDASESEDKNKNIHSMHILQPDGSRLYFIPGSSLKGMLRSVLSIMSFGKMGDYNNRYFGHREFDTKITDGKKYQEEMKKVKYGWLSKNKETEEYYLSPCAVDAEKISISEVEAKYGRYNDKYKLAWDRNDFIAKGGKLFPEYNVNGVKYRLFATGQIHNKKHELLIPVEKERPNKVDSKVMESFFTVYKPTPKFDKFKDMLEEGREIPVSFLYVPNSESIAVIGMGRMLRLPFTYCVKQLVEKGQPVAQHVGKQDLCETIFGWADRNNSMKGRVQISNAFATDKIDEEDSVTGVLGEPKASFYPLYLRQESCPYKTYASTEACISGRKRYRIHQGGSTTELPLGNDNENTKTTICPISAGHTFKMRINVHNLRKMEIGALLSALTFHRTEGASHNIGGAKSFGYGKMKIDCCEIKLFGLKYSEEEYLRQFENEMDSFMKESEGCSWYNSSQMKSLVAIASDHRDEEVRMMVMKEYLEYKKNNNFSLLRDVSDGVKTVLRQEDLLKAKYDKQYKDVLSLRSNREYLSSLEKLNDLIKSLQDSQLPSDREEQLFKEIRAEEFESKSRQIKPLVDGHDYAKAKLMLNNWMSELRLHDIPFDEEQQLLADVENEEKVYNDALKEGRLEKGLSASLDEKYTEGPNSGQCKVTTWKMCSSKLNKWMKDIGETSLSSDEQDALEQTILRMKASPDKKEKKEWNDFQSKIWKEISAHLSAERAQKIFSNQ